MYKLLYGEILMVGEGGFSFSSALLDKLEPSLYPHITATSLETVESIMKHALVQENIAHLREKGVTVELSIDATQLHLHPAFSKQTFDCVVFNFPHAGGKSNHKKNRKLLNDFFASAVKVLSDKGQIIMTLCKGQGGTPADQPMRAWHDSWQVVSMAANSDLVLTQTVPFSREDYDTYTSTGFRSLDKGFHTENAITHVFEKASRVDVPETVADIPVLIRSALYKCPTYLYKKLGTIRQISQTGSHPIHTIFKLLETGTSLTEQRCSNDSKDTSQSTMWCPILDGHLPTGQANLTEDSITSASHQCKTEISVDSVQKALGIHHGVAGYILQPVSHLEHPSHIDNDVLDSMVQERPKFNNSDGRNNFHFVSHPLEMIDIDDGDRRNMEVVCNYGPVFTHKTISVSDLPVEVFMNISHRVPYTGPMSETDVAIGAAKPFLATLEKVFNSILDASQSGQHFQVRFHKDTHGLDFNDFHLIACMLLKPTATDPRHGSCSSFDQVDTEVGSVYIKKVNDDIFLLVCSINLSKVTSAVCHLDDERLLWSMDRRVLGQFIYLQQSLSQCDARLPSGDSCTSHAATEPDSCNFQLKTDLKEYCSNSEYNGQPKQYKSFSLFPLTFPHDMSFWENSECDFDENVYYDIIRNAADDNVVSVTLIDSFSEPVSCRKSRCYRLVFQSIDCALSYDSSWKLQSLVRLEVQKQMNIVLR